jgi:hypothetical protein
MMTDKTSIPDRARILAACGANFSRWPQDHVGPARAALLSDPEFRRAWEAERDLDLGLAAYRDSLDRSIEVSKAPSRVGTRVLKRLPAAPLAALPWRKVAAAMIVAGALGGAMDLVLPEQAGDVSDGAAIDPLLTLDDTAL